MSWEALRKAINGLVNKVNVSNLKGIVLELFGQNIIPGGQSGLNNSPYFADQAELWLANETVPFRYYPAQVAEGAIGRAFFVPLPPESE